MNILALDLGTTTGWASSTAGGLASGAEPFKQSRFEGAGMRYLKFKRWLAQRLASMGEIHAVYFEEVRSHRGTDAAHVYGGFMATLTTFCEAHSIPYKGIGVGVIKKHWTGNGGASKADMIAKARQLGYQPADDNEADAIALRDFAFGEGL